MTRLNSQSFQKNAEFFVIVVGKKSFLITSYDKQANTSQKVLEYLISHLVLFQAVEIRCSTL